MDLICQTGNGGACIILLCHLMAVVNGWLTVDFNFACGVFFRVLRCSSCLVWRLLVIDLFFVRLPVNDPRGLVLFALICLDLPDTGYYRNQDNGDFKNLQPVHPRIFGALSCSELLRCALYHALHLTARHGFN